MKFLKFFICASFFLYSFLSFNQETTEFDSEKIFINEWLYSGGFSVKMPVSNDDEDINGHSFDEKALLQFNHFDIKKFRPAQGEKVSFSDDNWITKKGNHEGKVNQNINSENDQQIHYFVAYVEANRWLEGKLCFESNSLMEVYLDGKPIGGIYNINEKPSKFIKDIKLEKKNYTIVLKILTNSHINKEFDFSGSIEIRTPYSKDDLKTWTNPKHFMDISHVLEGPHISSIKVSADGRYFLVEHDEVTPPDGKRILKIELYEREMKRLVRTIYNHNYHQIQWLPKGHQFSYISDETLFISDAASGEIKSVVEDVNIEDYQWSLTGDFIIYSIRENAPEKNPLAHKLEDMRDRRSNWRNRSFLYKFNIKTGIKQRLTFGNQSTQLHDISPDGLKIIYSEDEIDNANRPFLKQYLYELSFLNFHLDTIWVKNFEGYVKYSPDGKKILVTGGANVFGSVGLNLRDQKISNDYDIQAYIYDLKNKQVDPITIDFDPSIEDAFWVKKSKIYFKTRDQSFQNLYEYDLDLRKFKKIQTISDVLVNINFSVLSNIVGYTSNGINQWTKGYLMNIATGELEMVIDPSKEFFNDIEFGRKKDWLYTNDNGKVLEGYVYFPPHFDSQKKYPLIVYYYGGTLPTERGFGGRYPKELFAAHGYVVYVINPSGAIGYGQEFSAAHVNNWGITVADEIIEASKQFVLENSFIDENKIGCIGASYGGFMTMLLMTETDFFTTGIAHAGISSISSYWGEGFWGYTYSTIASANSFPWNNKELYIQQSPLFNADKHNNSILLLHGGSDTNVPVGESIQMYTALKLLGKSVEYINIPEQDHHILDYKKRIFWQKTIAAWFDKELKGEPQWWNDLYPGSNLK